MATKITKSRKRSRGDSVDRPLKRLWDNTEITEDDWDTEFIIGEDPDEVPHTNEEEQYLLQLSDQEREALEAEELRLHKLMAQDVPLKYRIINTDASDKVKSISLTYLKRYLDDPENNSTCLTAAEKICEIPWNKHHKIEISKNQRAKFLESAYETMNQTIYGQETAKLEIIEYLTGYINNHQHSSVLGLHGPPGIGKTSLIKEAISKVMGDRPFYYISLGGVTDVSFLIGSRAVWKGSQPGRLTEAVIASKCMNPIFYFDELDKINMAEKGQDILNFLVHLTDPVQNSHIYDTFLNISLDLSGAMFVFSYNDREIINSGPLLDRIKEIHMVGYNAQEKMVISKNYLIPKISDKFGVNIDEICIFTDNVINYLNKLAGGADGVRPIIHIYKTLIGKILTNITLSNNSGVLGNKYPLKIAKKQLPLKLTIPIINKYLNN